MATAKKKPSPAQLAARKRFAASARAGTLKKKLARKIARKAAPRQNPLRKEVGDFYDVQTLSRAKYHVHMAEAQPGGGDTFLAAFASKKHAVDYGRAYADTYGKKIKVVSL